MKPHFCVFRRPFCLSRKSHALPQHVPTTHNSGSSGSSRRLASAAAAAPPQTQTSAVHRGVAFEERSMDILRHDMSMALKRVGGRDDGGIDFFGWWWLPHESESESSPTTMGGSERRRHHRRLSSGGGVLHPRRRIRVIGQCKAEKKKVGPHYVRELEGVLYRFLTLRVESDQQQQVFKLLDDDDDDATQPDGEILSPAIALLVSQSAFTKSTVLRANSSAIPFCLLHLPPVGPAPGDTDADAENDLSSSSPDEPSGNVGSVWCNPALCGARGLLKGRMEVRWERHAENSGSARPALWWDGIRLSSWVPPEQALTSSATIPGITVERT